MELFLVEGDLRIHRQKYLYKDLEQLSNDLTSQHRVAMPLNQLPLRISMRARALCQCVQPAYQLWTLPNSEFGFIASSSLASCASP